MNTNPTAGVPDFAQRSRVLMPVRWRPDIGAARVDLRTRILDRLDTTGGCTVTLLSVVDAAQEAAAAAALENLRRQLPVAGVTVQVIAGGSPVEAILAAAPRHDLLILGASEPDPEAAAAREPHLFDAVVDPVVQAAPCPALVVRGGGLADGWEPRRVLLPYDGARAARAAAELAFTVAGGSAERVVVLNVIDRETALEAARAGSADIARILEARGAMVSEAGASGRRRGIEVEPQVRVGSEADEVVLRLVRDDGFDLLVLGAEGRPGSRRLLLGPRVERIIYHARCPVVLLHLP